MNRGAGKLVDGLRHSFFEALQAEVEFNLFRHRAPTEQERLGMLMIKHDETDPTHIGSLAGCVAGSAQEYEECAFDLHLRIPLDFAQAEKAFGSKCSRESAMTAPADVMLSGMKIPPRERKAF